MNRYIFRRNNGSGLAQYGIILALIAVVVVPGFFLIGKSVVKSFNEFSVYLRGDSESASTTSDSSKPETTQISSGETSAPGSTETSSDGTAVLNINEETVEVPSGDSVFMETVGVAGDEPLKSPETAEIMPSSIAPEPVAVLESPGTTSLYVGTETPTSILESEGTTSLYVGGSSDYSDTPEETSGSPGIAVPTDEFIDTTPQSSI